MFCRDLGYALSTVRAKKIQMLYRQLKSKKKANILLDEYSAVFKTKKSYLKDIFHAQTDYIESFNSYMGSKKICIVGNAANIKSKNLGQKIDHHDIVIRFNNCCQKENKSDLGIKRDVWISAPNIKNVIPTEWIVVTGPNMIYRGANWSRFSKLDLNKNRVISIPLNIWKEMVSLLKAPPSAGILLLYWIKTIKKGFQDVSMVGFDLKLNKQQYHYADANHKAGERHNWIKEKALLSSWIQDGLTQLDNEGQKY